MLLWDYILFYKIKDIASKQKNNLSIEYLFSLFG